jgi:hypothetical protein
MDSHVPESWGEYQKPATPQGPVWHPGFWANKWNWWAVVIAVVPILVAFIVVCLGTKAPDILGTVIIVLGAMGVYFLPTIGAFIKSHHNAGAILVLNLFLGWTLIGWVAALVWATTRSQAPSSSRLL